ncbi:MAG: SUMF1/EgtB/PvdO family nonheme iron enzyme [Polyangiaceae bacterium]
MDRFEYPNRVGELPQVLTSWHQAVKACADQGKRLCTEDEFNFACEGPEMLPYVYGYVRDENKCNIDKTYIYPDHSKVLPTYETCLLTPACADELKRLDQREKIGQRTSCVSWAGIFDLNGNVNEWVNLPGKTTQSQWSQRRMVGPCTKPMSAHRDLSQRERLRLRSRLSLL